MPDTLYFAYGSNLSIEQIKHRCPDTVLVQPYTVSNWELAFCPHGDIREMSGGAVHGALYRLSLYDESIMDTYEVNYSKIYFDSTLEDGTVENCMTYIADERHLLTPPTPDYFHRIRVGYNDWKIPTEPLFDAYRKSVGNESTEIPPEFLNGNPRPITVKPPKNMD